MGITSLKEELHQYVDQGDKKLLHIIRAIARAYFEEDDLLKASVEEASGSPYPAMYSQTSRLWIRYVQSINLQIFWTEEVKTSFNNETMYIPYS